MKSYDLQIHTDASPCSNANPRKVVAAAQRAELDGIGVTDHDTMANVDAVIHHAPPDLTVIPGVEVTTTQGHLLALGVEEPPPPGEPLSVIADIHSQNGVAVLSHPFDTLRESYDRNLDHILKATDGIEVVNSRCLLPQYNRRARKAATAYGLAVTGSSDAHFPMEVGRAFTVSSSDCIEAIHSGTTTAKGRGGYISGHVATKVHQLRNRLR